MYRYIAFLGFIGFMMCVETGLAESTPFKSGVIETSREPANRYELAGKNISIYYSASDPDNESRLTYRRGAKFSRHFTGDDIRVEHTEIAQLVTVTLHQVADLKTITLSLLIPSVNLDENHQALFETKALITGHHTTIGGPDWVEGPIQTYHSAKLFGRASHVETPPEDASGVIGKVRVSPICPGPQQPGQVCAGPLSNVPVQIHDELDNIVGTAITDSQGFFSIATNPGNFTVHVDTDGVFPHCPLRSLTVPDRLVLITINCDSGIR